MDPNARRTWATRVFVIHALSISTELRGMALGLRTGRLIEKKDGPSLTVLLPT